MKKGMAVCVMAAAVLSFSPAVFAEVEIGRPAPDFSLPSAFGETVSLSDYQGKFVVLEWTNYDCPFVKKFYSAGKMQALQAEYTGKDIIWLSVNSSAPGQQGNYTPVEWNQMVIKKKAVPTHVLLDEDGTVGRRYGAQTTPHMFVINREGDVIYQGAIDDTPSTDPNDIPESVNYVERALDEALSEKPVSIPSTKSYGCSVKY